jgi:hypothetical protein
LCAFTEDHGEGNTVGIKPLAVPPAKEGKQDISLCVPGLRMLVSVCVCLSVCV